MDAHPIQAAYDRPPSSVIVHAPKCAVYCKRARPAHQRSWTVHSPRRTRHSLPASIPEHHPEQYLPCHNPWQPSAEPPCWRWTHHHRTTLLALTGEVPTARYRVRDGSTEAASRTADGLLRTNHVRAYPGKPVPARRTASPEPGPALWSDSSFALYPSCCSTTCLHANLHGFAGALLKVICRALSQCFQCTSV